MISRYRFPALLLLLAVAAACTSGPSAPDDRSYVETLAEERVEKERAFREGSDSPIPRERKDDLLPLNYYPIDQAYSVPAALRIEQERPVFEMPTSTGRLRKMERVGTLEFTLDGRSLSLGAFVEAGTRRIDRLFVPFADTTAGTETYSAGRYLDLDPTATGIYVIDFNRAYNPFCAYNETYDCPFPPPSNRLPVPVRAGERVPGSVARTAAATAPSR